MFNIARLVPFAAIVAITAGCAQTPARSDAPAAAPGATSPVKPAPKLTQTQWKLKELKGKKVVRTAPEQRDVTLLLAEGRASGHSGCNQMMGGYTSDGVSTLSFAQLAGTMMMCQPQDMDLERELLTTLGEVNGYRYADQELLLLKDGVPVARYEALTVK
ncbi:META domain-containing protein [Janthinobacterium sp. HLX7-2]|uniref:META domain-containing protein n=1 Tax=Janthinobacterium sp. HLX7-2 TaxID=1259331 RepID=UPI003F1ED61C